MEEAEECIRHGEYTEAAKRFTEDVGWPSEVTRQAEWFPRVYVLGLARQLGQCGQIGQASDLIRDLIRKVNPELLAVRSGEMDEFLRRIVHILTESSEQPFDGGLEVTMLHRIEYLHQLADLEDDPFLIVVSARAYLRRQVAEALADCTYRLKARDLLTRATDIVKGLGASKEQEAMFAQVAKAMLRTGQRPQALAYAEGLITDSAIGTEFYMEYAEHAATVIP